MRTNSPAERIALNPKREHKPILGWQALQGKVVIDENNSIVILRSRYGGMATYRSIR